MYVLIIMEIKKNLHYLIMMGDFEIVDKKNIKLEEYNVKEVEIKKSC